MADESNQNGAGLSSYVVPALLAVLALAGGFAWSLTPLNSLRPTTEVRNPFSITRPQNIEARLWQDPITAVYRAQTEAHTTGTSAERKGEFQPLTINEINFLVADAVRLARTFIRNLTRGNTVWPELTLEVERSKVGAYHSTDVIEWLDIQFIDSLTKSISGLVFYPAIRLYRT